MESLETPSEPDWKLEESPANHFNPDRWVLPDDKPDEVRKKKLELPDWPAFGAGGRVCPGQTLTQISMVAAIATLFNDYSLELIVSDETLKENNGVRGLAETETRRNAIKMLLEDVICENSVIRMPKALPIRLVPRPRKKHPSSPPKMGLKTKYRPPEVFDAHTYETVIDGKPAQMMAQGLHPGSVKTVAVPLENDKPIEKLEKWMFYPTQTSTGAKDQPERHPQTTASTSKDVQTPRKPKRTLERERVKPVLQATAERATASRVTESQATAERATEPRKAQKPEPLRPSAKCTQPERHEARVEQSGSQGSHSLFHSWFDFSNTKQSAEVPQQQKTRNPTQAAFESWKPVSRVREGREQSNSQKTTELPAQTSRETQPAVSAPSAVKRQKQATMAKQAEEEARAMRDSVQPSEPLPYMFGALPEGQEPQHEVEPREVEARYETHYEDVETNGKKVRVARKRRV